VRVNVLGEIDTTVNALNVLVGLDIVAVDVVAVSDDTETLPDVNVAGDTVVNDDDDTVAVEKVDVNDDGDMDADSKVGGTVVVTSSEVTVSVDVVIVRSNGEIFVSERVYAEEKVIADNANMIRIFFENMTCSTI